MASKIFSFILVGFFSVTAFAKAKFHCSPTELEQKNCQLKARGLAITVNKEVVSINDGVWPAIGSVYGKNEALEWDKVRLRHFAKRNFLEVKFWGEPKGETMVQSLYWLVYEIRGTQLNKRIDKIIKKRHKIEDNKFLFDPMEKHGIVEFGHGKVKWWFKDQVDYF